MARRTHKQLSAAISVMSRFPKKATPARVERLVSECLDGGHLQTAYSAIRRWGHLCSKTLLSRARDAGLKQPSDHVVHTKHQRQHRTRYEHSLDEWAETGYLESTHLHYGDAGLLCAVDNALTRAELLATVRTKREPETQRPRRWRLATR